LLVNLTAQPENKLLYKLETNGKTDREWQVAVYFGAVVQCDTAVREMRKTRNKIGNVHITYH